MCRALTVAVQIVWFGLAIAFPLQDDYRYEGDSCTLVDGVTSGMCRRDVECEYLKSIPKNDWKMCSFDWNITIVCCRDKPASAIQGSPNLIRSNILSERMCEGYPLFPDTGNHIIHGIQAVADDFPYLGALAFQNGNEVAFRCGANLISRQFMLTAAHCLTAEVPAFVRLGVVNIVDTNATDAPIDVGIEKVIVHPKYTTRPLANDIALLKLNRTVDEPFLIPACLYTNLSDPLPHVNLSIAGWGTTETNDWEMSPNLMKARVTTYDREECNTTLVEDKTSGRRKLPQLNDDQLCAVGRNETHDNTGDTCVGDSGGPLELSMDRRRYIVGLTSTGKICGSKHPGIYTRVSHFIDWIESVVWPAG